MTAEVKIYDGEQFRFRFMPAGGPMEGTLFTECAEHPPFASRVSLDKPRSRKEYSKEAAAHAGLEEEALATALADLCSTRFEEVEAAAEAEKGADDPEDQAPEVSEEEIDARIGRPGVLKRLVSDAAAFSKVVGEKYVLALLFLVFLSSQLAPLPSGKPLTANLVLSAPPGRGKNYLADAVARTLPEDFYYAFEASSAKSLYYKAKSDGPACIKHRLVYPNEAEAVDPLVETFRPLLSSGRAKLVTVGKFGGEENVVQEIEVEGPLGLIVPTVRNKLDKQLQSRMLISDLDEYEGRVAAHSAAVSAQLALDYAGADHSREISAWRAALRSLTGTRRVAIPALGEGFRFDSDAVPHGARLWNNFLALMCANAWLEQRNREIVTLENGERAIVAAPRDYKTAYKVFEETCERSVENVSDTHRKILDALYELREAEGPFVGFSQRKIAERSGVPQSTVSDNKSFLTMSLKWVWEPEGGGLALVHDAEPEWWEKGDALVGFPRPEEVERWWGGSE